MMLLADPYALLHTEPVRRFAFIIVPEGSRVNLGLLYVRGAEADARGAPGRPAHACCSARGVCARRRRYVSRPSISRRRRRGAARAL